MGFVYGTQSQLLYHALFPTQDRSEDTKRREQRSDDARRKSRRVRHTSPALSDASAPSTSQANIGDGCAITSASPSARSSLRSAGTAAPNSSNGCQSVALRPVRTTRSLRASLASQSKGSSADLLEGEGSNCVLPHCWACTAGS